MGFFLALGVIIFGSTMFICEGGVFMVTDETPNGAFIREDLYGSKEDLSPFTSIPIAFYWAVTTSTTVGYGDLFPTTTGGRMVCIVSTFCAMIVLALPISVIGNNFNREYDNIKSGKFDVVVESIVELLNQQTINMAEVSDESRDYVLSRRCLAITAIADHMTNTIQAEKVKTTLRLHGYEKALERTRVLAKKKGKRVSLCFGSNTPKMGPIGESPGSNNNISRSARAIAGSPEKLRKVAAMSKQLRELLLSLREE